MRRAQLIVGAVLLVSEVVSVLQPAFSSLVLSEEELRRFSVRSHFLTFSISNRSAYVWHRVHGSFHLATCWLETSGKGCLTCWLATLQAKAHIDN